MRAVDGVFVQRAPKAATASAGRRGSAAQWHLKVRFLGAHRASPHAASRAGLRAWRRSSSNLQWSSRPAGKREDLKACEAMAAEDKVGPSFRPAAGDPLRLPRLRPFALLRSCRWLPRTGHRSFLHRAAVPAAWLALPVSGFPLLSLLPACVFPWVSQCPGWPACPICRLPSPTCIFPPNRPASPCHALLH